MLLIKISVIYLHIKNINYKGLYAVSFEVCSIVFLSVVLLNWSHQHAAAFEENDFSISSSISSVEPSYVQEYRQYLKNEGFNEFCVIENFASPHPQLSITSRRNLNSQQAILGSNKNTTNLPEASVDSIEYMCDFIAAHKIVILDLSVADRLEEIMDDLPGEKKTDFLSCLQKLVTENENKILGLKHLNQARADLSVQDESVLWKNSKKFAVGFFVSTVASYVVTKAYLYYCAK